MKSKNITDFEQMGMAALLPGIQYALERMEKLRDEMRQLLGIAQTQSIVKSRKNSSSGWPDTPEGRKAEMMRRRAVAQKRARANAAETRWARMTRKEREEWKAKMVAAKRRAKRETKKSPVVNVGGGAGLLAGPKKPVQETAA